MPNSSTYPAKCKVAVIGRYFSPASGSDVIRMGAPVSAYAGKKKVLLVEPKSKKGFEVGKSWRQTWCCTRQLFAGMKKLMLHYRRAEKSWRSEGM